MVETEAVDKTPVDNGSPDAEVVDDITALQAALRGTLARHKYNVKLTSVVTIQRYGSGQLLPVPGCMIRTLHDADVV